MKLADAHVGRADTGRPVGTISAVDVLPRAVRLRSARGVDLESFRNDVVRPRPAISCRWQLRIGPRQDSWMAGTGVAWPSWLTSHRAIGVTHVCSSSQNRSDHPGAAGVTAPDHAAFLKPQETPAGALRGMHFIRHPWNCLLPRATSVFVITSSLRFERLGQVHLAFGDVRFFPGACSHRLTVQAKVTGTWLKPDEPLSNAAMLLTGTVWTEQPSYRWLAGLEPQVLTLRGYQVSEELAIDVADDQLIALERARGEDDIVLTLKLQATLLAATPVVYPVVREEVGYRIPRTLWLELLDQVGSEVGIVIRVPSPLTDSAVQWPPAASDEDDASLSQAAARLRQARTELREHRWESCVATCRKVLDNLAYLATIPPVRPTFAVAAENRNQEQRWAAIYHDVKSMTSAAHHDDNVTDGFTWSHTDAEAILAATAGLLARYTASVIDPRRK